MLEELTVKNYALIDNVTLRFGAGFNVLTGETGAGKSILIDALSLVLGGKGGTHEIRSGADQAEVTALFHTPHTPELREWCEKYGIEPEDDTVIIRRVIRANGRSLANIQAVPVTRTALTELADLLVDLHGQHEHQSLFQIATHRKLLDRFAGLEERVRTFSLRFIECDNMGKRIEELKHSVEQALQKTDFLKRAIQEIDSAKLRNGEEEELVERQKILSCSEELIMELKKVTHTNSENGSGVVQILQNTMEGLAGAKKIDQSLASLHERFSTAFYEIEDIVEDIRHRLEHPDYDPAELANVDARLNTISILEKKFNAPSIAGLLSFAKESQLKIKGCG